MTQHGIFQCTQKMVLVKLGFHTWTKLPFQIWKVHEKPHKISIHLVIGLCSSHFDEIILHSNQVVFQCWEIDKHTPYIIIIFLRFSLYLLQFSTYKNLIYTKLLHMLWEFCRIWPFYSSPSTTRVTASEASPLFYASPLILLVSTISFSK